MINVVIKKNKANQPYYFEVSGHAGYANLGNDIVCAAISVLTITVANSIEKNTSDEKKIMVNEKDATITIEMPTIRDNKASAEIIVLANTLYQGIKDVDEEYEHKYISVKEESYND